MIILCVVDELVVSIRDSYLKIAVLSDGELVDYQVESTNSYFNVGDIFVGKIKKRANGINAFFIDINSNKDGFLHFDDLSENVFAFSDFSESLRKKKNVKITSCDYKPVDVSSKENIDKVVSNLKVGQKVIVQILKEPISQKGPRLTTRISLPGKYIVLVPLNDNVCVSKEINNESTKNFLVGIVTRIKDRLKLNHYGFIVRTSTEDLLKKETNEKKIEEIFVDDIINLLGKFSDGIEVLKEAENGTKIINTDNRVFTIIKDRLSNPFDIIYVDNKLIYDQIKKEFSNEYSNGKALKFYVNDVKSLFYYKQIDKQLKLLLNRNVKINDGAYLIIEKTEAMNVIDVNSGSTDLDSDKHEEMVFITNMNATKEIVRQIYLRDMGGIIAIDYIDMENQAHRIKIYEKMKELLSKDKSSSFILPLSRNNVMLITRQRFRPVLAIDNEEKCPLCKNTGKVEPIINIPYIIEDKMVYFLKNIKCLVVTFFLNPLLVPFFLKGFFSKRFRLCVRFCKIIKVKEDYAAELGHIKVSSGKKILFECNCY